MPGDDETPQGQPAQDNALEFMTPEMLGELQAFSERMADLHVADVRERFGIDPATARNLWKGSELAVNAFVAMVRGESAGTDFDVFREGGRQQFAGGRPLTELIAFYRRGVLVMWRGAMGLKTYQDLTREQVVEFGEAVLSFVDVLSGAAVEGYHQREALAERNRRVKREHLVRLLLSGPGSEEALDRAAESAGWECPERLRVALLYEPEVPREGGGAPPSRVLVAGEPGRIMMIIADTEEADEWLLRTARALGIPPPLAIGPAVPAAQAQRSHRLASALLDVAHMIDAPGPILHAEDHLMDLLLTLDDDLAELISVKRLAPILELESQARDRMLETLSAWLSHPRRPQSIAQELDLHVQTVRYRLDKLRELVGDALDDPAERVQFAIALRLRDTLGRGAAGAPDA